MAVTGLTGAPIHKGSWFGLPDIGLTELLQGTKSTSPVQQTGVPASSTGIRNYTPINYSPYIPAKTQTVSDRGQVLGIQSGGGSQQQSNQEPQYPEFNQPSPSEPLGGGPSEQDMINEEFNRFNAYLGEQENLARQNYGETTGLAGTQKAGQEKLYKEDLASQTEGIKKNEALNLKKVRDLLRDLSQADAARVAIYGGGSTAEALGARFGREAQSRLGTVMSETQAALDRVNSFYNQSIQKLKDNYDSFVLQAKQSLDANLSAIQGQRLQSAAAKQQGIMQAWRDYYDNVNRAKTEAATFKAQYDMWKQQQDAAYAQTGAWNESNASALNQGMAGVLDPTQAAAGQQQQPYSMNPQYRIFNPKSGKYEEDPLAPYGSNFMNNLKSGMTQ